MMQVPCWQNIYDVLVLLAPLHYLYAIMPKEGSMKVRLGLCNDCNYWCSDPQLEVNHLEYHVELSILCLMLQLEPLAYF